MPDITIPAELLPTDGRFGSGPTKVRPEALAALAERATDYMGTSHRQMPVKLVVAEMRNGIAELLRAPDGYEIVCGNGGSTGFWDAAVFGLIDEKSTISASASSGEVRQGRGHGPSPAGPIGHRVGNGHPPRPRARRRRRRLRVHP